MLIKAIIDIIHKQKFIKTFNNMNLNNNLFIIVFYTNLKNIIRNLESRRKKEKKEIIEDYHH